MQKRGEPVIAPEFRRHREQDRTAVIMVGPERWGGTKRGKNNNREKKRQKKEKGGIRQKKNSGCRAETESPPADRRTLL